jgi:hypothetical protein
VHIGNFVEMKNSTLGDGAKANHLAYLGDATSASASTTAPAASPPTTTARTSTARRSARRAHRQQLRAGRAGDRRRRRDDRRRLALLNAAYEVLIDPKHRQEYDATLLQPAKAISSFAPAAPADMRESDRSGSSTHVDMNWMPQGVVSTAKPLWPPSRRTTLMGGGALAVIILATAGVSWQVMGQRQMERAMSDQYATRPAGSAAPVEVEADDAAHEPAAVAKAPPARRPSVAELARMSDEELLQVLPDIDGQAERTPAPAKAKAGGNRRAASMQRHPLDGKPLNLRTESHLMDPLAPEPTLKDQRARR